MMKIIYLTLVFSMIVPFIAQADTKAPIEKFDLSSPAFKDGEDIPSVYTCNGGNINPPFVIMNTPAQTKSMAFTMHDPDAPQGTWVHWVVYNIPPERTAILKNSTPGSQLLNDFGTYYYGGPCPEDEKPHHYVFRAYALDIIFENNEGLTMKDLEKIMGGHIIAKDEYIGVYRKPLW